MTGQASPGHPARAVLVALATAVVGALAVGVLLGTARSSWAAIAGPGPASPADGILLVLGALGALVAAWSGLGLALSALSALPGAAGRAASRASARLAPAAVRRVAAFLIGTTLTAAMVPGTAVASGSASAPVQATASSAAQLPGAPDPAFAPSRSTVASAPDPSFAPGPPAAGAPDPSWTPSRPVAARRSQPAVDLLSSRPVAGRSVDDHLVVRRGDTLWDIAARHLGPGAGAAEVAREWPRWYAANRHVIGDDPDVLRPGELLTPPDSGESA